MALESFEKKSSHILMNSRIQHSSSFSLYFILFENNRLLPVEEHTRDYIFEGALQKFTFNGNDIIKQCREQKFNCEMPGRATSIPELSQTYRKPGTISNLFFHRNSYKNLSRFQSLLAKKWSILVKLWSFERKFGLKDT